MTPFDLSRPLGDRDRPRGRLFRTAVAVSAMIVGPPVVRRAVKVVFHWFRRRKENLKDKMQGQGQDELPPHRNEKGSAVVIAHEGEDGQRKGLSASDDDMPMELTANLAIAAMLCTLAYTRLV